MVSTLPPQVPSVHGRLSDLFPGEAGPRDDLLPAEPPGAQVTGRRGRLGAFTLRVQHEVLNAVKTIPVKLRGTNEMQKFPDFQQRCSLRLIEEERSQPDRSGRAELGLDTRHKCLVST